MLDTFDGLPIHTLVVHGVVVLLPLGALGTIAVALRPAWRRTYGVLVATAVAAATVLIPVAVRSGQEFKKRVGDPGHHDNLGKQLIWFALPLLVLVVVLVVLDRREVVADGDGAAERTSGSSTALNVIAGLALVAAVACSVQVYRVGESGARAAWGAVVESTN